MTRNPNSNIGSAGLDADTIASRLAVIRRHSGNVSAAAREMDIGRQGLQDTWSKHRDSEIPRQLTSLGYDLAVPDRTPQDAWLAHLGAAERKISKVLKNRWRTISRPPGPFVIFHSTDEHIDDDATPLFLIDADIKAAHSLGAIMCHGGDLLNNWPLAGKLAKQWAEQSCTMPDALLRAQHFIDIFKPDVWTDGNHEEMNPYLHSMLHGWLPATCVTDYWKVNFEVQTGGRPVRCIMSHKFQKGSSWFHPHHGTLREMMEGEDADLYMEGHLHISGDIYRTLPERGLSATAVSSAGYKIVDQYAARISRGGTIPKLKGRAHFIVCDPDADEDDKVCTVFGGARQAEAYLNGLQNLRAA